MISLNTEREQKDRRDSFSLRITTCCLELSMEEIGGRNVLRLTIHYCARGKAGIGSYLLDLLRPFLY